MAQEDKTPMEPKEQDTPKAGTPDEPESAGDSPAATDSPAKGRGRLPGLPPMGLPALVAVFWVLAALVGWRALDQINAEGASARGEGARDRVAGAVARGRRSGLGQQRPGVERRLC